jgi:hypothetical protein
MNGRGDLASAIELDLIASPLPEQRHFVWRLRAALASRGERERLRNAELCRVRELYPGMTVSGGPSSNVKRTVADAEQALGRLADERASANRAIIAAADERRRMLLANASDDAIVEFDKRVDALRLVIDRCDVAEPRLVAELEGLRCGARQAR